MFQMSSKGDNILRSLKIQHNKKKLQYDKREGKKKQTDLGAMLITYHQSRDREPIMNDKFSIILRSLQ